MFNSIGSAFLTIFRCVTLEDWSFAMYMVQDAFHPVGAALFFVVLISFAAFFLLNILFSVMWQTFEQNAQEEIVARASAQFAVIQARKKVFSGWVTPAG